MLSKSYIEFVSFLPKGKEERAAMYSNEVVKQTSDPSIAYLFLALLLARAG